MNVFGRAKYSGQLAGQVFLLYTTLVLVCTRFEQDQSKSPIFIRVEKNEKMKEQFGQNRWGTDDLQWLVGLLNAFLGAIMLVTPHQFSTLQQPDLRVLLFPYGVSLLMSGCLLMSVFVLRSRGWLLRAVQLLNSLMLLILGSTLAASGTPIVGFSLIVLGLGEGLSPLLGKPHTDLPPVFSLFTLIVGINNLLTGLLVFAMPTTLKSNILYLELPFNRIFGAAFVLSGLWLALLPFLKRRLSEQAAQVVSWAARGAAVLMFATFLTVAVVPGEELLPITYFGWAMIGLVVLPMLVQRVRRPDPARLQTRLGLAFAFATAIPLIFTVALISNQEENLARIEVRKSVEYQAGSMSTAIADYLQLQQSTVQTLARHPGLLTMIEQDQQQLLNVYQESFSDLSGFTIYNRQGQRMAGGSFEQNVPSAVGQPTFEQVRKTGRVQMEVNFSTDLKQPLFGFSAPIRDAQGQFGGMVTFWHSPRRISDLLTSQSSASNENIYLVDETGRLVAQPPEALSVPFSEVTRQSKVRAALHSNESGSLRYESGETSWLTGYAPVPGTDLHILVERPEEAALATTYAGRNLALGTLLGFLLLTVTGSLYLAHWLAEPLQRLSHALQELAAEHDEVTLPHSTLSEIRSLSRAFGEIRGRLHRRTMEREQAFQTLEEQNALLQTILAQAADGILICDPQGKITFANTMARRIANIPPDMDLAISPHDWGEAYNQEGKRIPEEEWSLALALAGKTTTGREVRMVRADGSFYDILISAAPVRKSDGTLMGAVSVFADITQHKEAEDELRQTKEALEVRVTERTADLELANLRLQAVLKALPVAVIIADTKGQIVETNQLAAQIWGSPPQTLQDEHGRAVYQAWQTDTRTHLRREDLPLTRALNGETVVGDMIDIQTQAGETSTVLIGGAPVLDAQGRFLGAVAGALDISEQRRLEQIAKQAARDARKFAIELDAIFNALADAVVVYDQAGIVVRANAQAVAMFGFDPLRMDRKTVATRLSLQTIEGQPMAPDMLPSVRAINGEILVNARMVLTNPRGRTYTILASASPLYIGKEIEGIVSVWHDVTEREMLMTQLAYERARLETLMINTPAGMILTDGEGNIILSNAMAGRLLGEKVHGSAINMTSGYQICHLDGSPLTASELPIAKAVLQGQRSNNLEAVLHRANGSEIVILINAGPVYDARQQMVGAVMMFQDITQLKDVEQALLQTNQALGFANNALRESEAHERARAAELEALMDAVPAAVWIALDSQGQQVISNRAANELLRLSPGANASMTPLQPEEASPFRVFKNGEALSPDELPLQVSAREGVELRDFEEDLLYDDGEVRRLIGNVNPLLDDMGQPRGAIAAFTDVTALKQAQEFAQSYAAQLERSNHDLEQFAFVASHDLQEPLRKIKFFGERLQEHFNETLDEREIDFLDRMLNASTRMQTMINDLLTYSRVTTKAQPFEVVDLNTLAREVVSDLEVRILRSEGQVNIGELPRLEGDPMQMRQLLQNLIGNALKFHQAGQPPRVKVSGKAEGEFLTLYVQDNGIGFEDHYLERIFQPFERLHGRSEYEGSGMGLAICRKIVERHHGNITAKSQPGEGTTFIIQLPRHQPEEPTQQVQAQQPVE